MGMSGRGEARARDVGTVLLLCGGSFVDNRKGGAWHGLDAKPSGPSSCSPDPLTYARRLNEGRASTLRTTSPLNT